MIFGLLYFCVVILCVNRSRSSFILYRIVKRHSRQSNVRRIWACADNDLVPIFVNSYLSQLVPLFNTKRYQNQFVPSSILISFHTVIFRYCCPGLGRAQSAPIDRGLRGHNQTVFLELQLLFNSSDVNAGYLPHPV